MSEQIQIETPVVLNWEGITFNGEVYKQYLDTNVELNIKPIIELNNDNQLHYFFLLPARREYLDFVNIGVNLQTGIFHINGMKLDLRPDVFKPKDDGDSKIETIIPKYRLIFFRRHQVGIDDEDGKYKDKIFNYLLGWQANHGKKNYQRIMFINPTTLTIEIKEKR